MRKCASCALITQVNVDGLCDDCAWEAKQQKEKEKPMSTNQDEVSALRNQLAETQKMIQSLQQQQPQSLQQQQMAAAHKAFQQNPIGTAFEISRAAAAAEIAKAQEQDHETLVESAKRASQLEQPDAWALYPAEIEKRMEDSFGGTDQRAFWRNKNTWNTAAVYVYGQKQIEERRKAAEEKHAQTPKAPDVLSSRSYGVEAPTLRVSTEESPAAKLDPEQLATARMFKLTPEEYSRGQKFYEDQLATNGDANQPSPWDAVIPFDETGRKRFEKERGAA